VIGQPAPAEGIAAPTGLLRTLVIPGDPANDGELARANIAGPCFYLVRPDGHVGLAGTRFDAAAVARYLASCGIGTRESGADDAAIRRQLQPARA